MWTVRGIVFMDVILMAIRAFRFILRSLVDVSHSSCKPDCHEFDPEFFQSFTRNLTAYDLIYLVEREI